MTMEHSTIAAPAVATTRRWYAGVTAKNWRTLAAAFLGWGFDGYETQALIVVLIPAMHDLLGAGQSGNTAFWSGLAVGTTLFGWALGGVIGGIVADYVGRKRVMLFSILGYAIFTGLTALSPNYATLLVLRFLTGLTLGGEWATGTALIAETWPQQARAKAAGIMQAGFGFGSLLAALVWFVISPLGEGSWRLVFLFGILPALWTLYVRSQIDESERWQQATAARARRRLTLVEIFRSPTTRRRVLLALVLSLFSLAAYYVVATALPQFVTKMVGDQGIGHAPHWVSLAVIIYNVGAICGYITGGFLADAIGRRRYVGLFLIGAAVMTPILYLGAHSITAVIVLAGVNGFFTLGIFAAFAIYLPELFTSDVRGTGAGFVFNSTRIVAGFGPIVFGSLVSGLGGAASTATIMGFLFLVGLLVLPFLPETSGRPLPD